MGWCSEPDPDSPLGPGNSLSWHQFLDAVLPEDPGAHRLRDGWGADRELAQLLRLQAPGLPQGDAGAFGHSIRVSNWCSGKERERVWYLEGTGEAMPRSGSDSNLASIRRDPWRLVQALTIFCLNLLLPQLGQALI